MSIRRRTIQAEDVRSLVAHALRLARDERTGKPSFTHATALLIATAGAVQEATAERIETPEQAGYVLHNLTTAREMLSGILDRLEEQVRGKKAMLGD